MKCLRLCCAALVLCLLANAASAKMQFSDLGRPFEDRFAYEKTEWTETGYRSENIAVSISVQRVCDSDVYVADIYVRSAECLRRAFGSGEWNASSEKLDTLAEESGAVLALSGDNSHLLKAGYLAANGQVWRSRGNQKRDLCVLYTDGSMVTFYAPVDHETIARQMEEGQIWQTFVFGPALLDESGSAFDAFPNSDVNPRNPRAVIGCFEPGHYCLVQIDGRGTMSVLEENTDNEGMTLVETAQFMQSLGCRAAYNLDGGQTAAMWFRDDVISTPYHNGRAVGDAIVVCELQTDYDDSEAFLVE